MRLNSIILLFVFIVCRINAQDSKVILQKMASVYRNNNAFQVDMKFILYKGYFGKIDESYIGTLYQDKQKFYQKIDQTEFIVTSKFCSKISHIDKNVIIFSGEELINNNFQTEILKTIESCKKIEVTNLDKYYLLTMNFKNLVQHPYNKVTLKICKSNFHLAQLDIFYQGERDFSTKPRIIDMHLPHLRIMYSNFKEQPTISSNIFEFDTYFSSTKSTISLKGKLKTYNLTDKRVLKL